MPSRIATILGIEARVRVTDQHSRLHGDGLSTLHQRPQTATLVRSDIVGPRPSAGGERGEGEQQQQQQEEVEEEKDVILKTDRRVQRYPRQARRQRRADEEG